MKRERRNWSAEDKVKLLRQHLIGKIPVFRICGEARLSPNLFRRWLELLFQNAPLALERKRSAELDKDQIRIDKMEEKMRRKDELLANLMAEHLALKKQTWGTLNARWVEAKVRDEVVDYVRRWAESSGLGVGRMLGWLGLSVGKYYDWRERYGKINQHNGRVPRDFWLQEKEKQTILDYQTQYPCDGYRRLTHRLIDADVVAVSPSSVFRVLREAGRLRRYAQKSTKTGMSV